MQNILSRLIFRIFSANDWNQSEAIQPTYLFEFLSLLASTFFSNAEILRKTALSSTLNSLLECTRMHWNNGLKILFPLFPFCFNLSTIVR